jgi:hypothetical protein
MGIFFATIFASASDRGGQPTGTTALATDFRISETASPRRRFELRGQLQKGRRREEKETPPLSDHPIPQALLSIIFNLPTLVPIAGAVAVANQGSAATWFRNDRRIMRSD